jgi:hypothetical protein
VSIRAHQHRAKGVMAGRARLQSGMVGVMEQGSEVHECYKKNSYKINTNAGKVMIFFKN